jgi:predicted dehydrogenase
MRVAVTGVGHWHAVQMYLPALRKLNVDVVAVSDPDPAALDRADVTCPKFADYRELLGEVHPDFVFAHAPHCDMTSVARDLVRAGQGFAMEKPMGVDWRALSEVADEARERGVFAAVALVNRYLALVEKLAELRATGELGTPIHYYSRLFAGPPHRYREWGVDWMLDPGKAGAGPLFNFGPHGIDLWFHFGGEPVETVYAWASHALHHEKIEDIASLAFRGEGGATGVVEVSYSLPDEYTRDFSLTTDTLYVGGKIEGDAIRFRDGRKLAVEPEASATEGYGLYTKDTLERFAAGRPPKASIHDMVPVLRVMNAAQRSIAVGEVVRLGDV